MTITVVNAKVGKAGIGYRHLLARAEVPAHVVYVGRGSRGKPYIPGSVLANPYTVKEYTRTQAISAYREWLTTNRDPLVLAELARLRTLHQTHGQLTLCCWCKPEACHADVIAELLQE